MNIEELIDIIAKAFQGVEQPRVTTLHVAEAHDNYDYDNDDKHRKKDYFGPWENIPDEHIESCKHALSYLDKTGMRYYLPAYIIWTLKNVDNQNVDLDHALYSLDHSPKDAQLYAYHRERFSLFSPEQMRACALFVKFCAEDELDRIDAYFAQKKYERYWEQYEKI